MWMSLTAKTTFNIIIRSRIHQIKGILLSTESYSRKKYFQGKERKGLYFFRAVNSIDFLEGIFVFAFFRV
jgi:hypothetical protein